jgi:prevent-host-death family protein
MKTVAATEAKNRLGAILDDAQREPVVIRRQDRDIAVVLSMTEYERLRSGNIRAFLDLRNEVAVQAATAGLTQEKLTDLAEAVEHELAQRRRAALLESIQNPHLETTELVDVALCEWTADLPRDESLVDASAGTPIRWVKGQGWTKETA